MLIIFFNIKFCQREELLIKEKIDMQILNWSMAMKIFLIEQVVEWLMRSLNVTPTLAFITLYK